MAGQETQATPTKAARRKDSFAQFLFFESEACWRKGRLQGNTVGPCRQQLSPRCSRKPLCNGCAPLAAQAQKGALAAQLPLWERQIGYHVLPLPKHGMTTAFLAEEVAAGDVRDHRNSVLLSATSAIVASLMTVGLLIARGDPSSVREARVVPNELRSFLPSLVVRAADSAIAGIGLWSSISALGALQAHVSDSDHPLFMGSMMASGIIFFVGPTPPPPNPFLVGTLSSATVSLGVFFVLEKFLHPIAASGGAASALLIMYKSTGVVFPPAVALFGQMAQKATLQQELLYLFFPWLAGHATIYVWAWVFSYLRSYVRVAMMKAQLRELAENTDEELRRIFNLYDTSGDGTLDEDELKIALRKTMGVDLPIEDCRQIVAAADRDGTGTVDFDEFKNVCRQRL
eukprot:TRINITY_DN14696_c0_g1_i1.p1 TRINITY_DN14696_c0_g1~~TRINITY_DN14696_c0_g1_i1.p1  ORF type:complete len:416 (-),score=70.17 TRINITY_DN14696_c0_g1_i1:90-1292(-)